MALIGDLCKLADLAEHAAYAAGLELMKFYQGTICATFKQDGSPVTQADFASHNVIVRLLQESDIPIVSEEGDNLNLDASYYWLIDPLDGTKDFLAKNDEFTVNIALILNGSPILGVIYAPALDEFYLGAINESPWGRIRGIKTRCPQRPKGKSLSMAISRFHDTVEVMQFAVDNDILCKSPIGSSLKYCRMIMGEVDVYPRLIGTSEWDTAAGQILVESSGVAFWIGRVVSLLNMASLAGGIKDFLP